jgi:hypothetical protein
MKEDWFEIVDYETNMLYIVKDGKVIQKSEIPYVFTNEVFRKKVEMGEIKFVAIHKARELPEGK